MIFGDEERRLARRLNDGDKAAVREFYSRYADYLAGVCSRYIADEEDMKDVFQDAFVDILTHIGNFQYRGTGSLKASLPSPCPKTARMPPHRRSPKTTRRSPTSRPTPSSGC